MKRKKTFIDEHEMIKSMIENHMQLGRPFIDVLESLEIDANPEIWEDEEAHFHLHEEMQEKMRKEEALRTAERARQYQGIWLF